MTSCYRRLTTGPTPPNGPVPSRQRSTAEILSLPLKRISINQRPGIHVRSSRHSRSFIIEAVGPGGPWDRSDGGNEAEKVGPCAYSVGDQTVGGVVESIDRTVEINGKGIISESGSRRDVDRTVEVAVAAAITVVLGVGNRVLYKLALVPLKHYPFFLAQLATFGYSILTAYSLFRFYRFVCILIFPVLFWLLPRLPKLCFGYINILIAS